MGKKSLTKSTTKKKSKKTTGKGSGDAPAKKTAAAGKNTAKSQSALPAPLDRQFDAWVPKKPFTPKPDKSYRKNFASPPAIPGKGKDAQRRRALLLMPVGLEDEESPKEAAGQKTREKTTKKAEAAKEAKAAAKTADKAQKTAPAKPATASPKKKSVKELLALKFDTWTPNKPFAPDPKSTAEADFSAPEAFPGIDKSIVLKSFEPGIPETETPPEAKTVAQEEAVPDTTPEESSEKPPEEQPETTPETTAKKPPEEPAEARPAKAPVEQTPPVSRETLLQKDFGSWQPEKPFSPGANDAVEKNFSAPEAFPGIDKSIVLKSFEPGIPETETPPEAKTVAQEEAAPDTTPEESSEKPPEEQPETTPETTAKKPPGEPAESVPAAEPQEGPAAGVSGKPYETAAPAAGPGDEKPVETASPEMEGGPEEPEKTLEEEAAAGGGAGIGGGGGDDSGGPPPPPEREPLLERSTKILIGVVGFVLLVLVAASIANFNRFFIEETAEGIEILRGDFSPAGKHTIALLPDAGMPENPKPVYNREEAMTMAFDHYMGNARELMKDEETPLDLRAIRDNLNQAEPFAVTEEQARQVETRLTQVDYAMLLFRADVAAAEETREGYEKALEYLDRAGDLALTASERIAALDSKRREIEEKLQALAPETKPEEKPEVKPVEEPEETAEEITDESTEEPIEEPVQTIGDEPAEESGGETVGPSDDESEDT